MNKRSRTQNSIFNLFSGVGYRLIITITSFVVRTVFIQCLNEDYLGVNGLYSSILSMLSLAELGFGSAMVYSMYKPLAENDSVRLSQLMQLYKRAYEIIGTVILVIGLCLVPFLDVLIKDQPDVDGLTFYYILFLLNSVVSYWFFAYRNSLLQADQKAHVVTNYQTIFNLIKSLLQIVLLLLFRNYTLYLVTQILCTIGQNIALAFRVKKDYPHTLDKPEEKLPREETRRIFKDVKALMLGKISFVTLNSTDNLIISAFIGVSWVGLLSNFTMITEAVTGVLSQVASSITASMGNYFIKEDEDSGYTLFKRIDFLNYWLYGFSMIALAVLLTPFVTVWLGDAYALSIVVSISLAIRFFIEGYMQTMSAFRSALGLFVQGQYRGIYTSILNIVLSIALSFPFGLTGVLIATPLSRIVVQAWYSPLVVHRDGFHRSVKHYYAIFLARLLLLTFILCLCLLISNYVFAEGITIIRFIVVMLIVGILPNLIFFLIFFRTDEFKYFWKLGKEYVSKVVNQIHRK